MKWKCGLPPHTPPTKKSTASIFIGIASIATAEMFGKKPRVAAPPPPPTMEETIMMLVSEHPVLSAFIAVSVLGFVYLKIKASMSPKPRRYTKPKPEEIVEYRAGEPTWVVEPKAEAPVRVAKSGIASLPALTLNELFAGALTGLEPAADCARRFGRSRC